MGCCPPGLRKLDRKMTVAIFGEDALDHYPVSNVKKPSSFAELNPSRQETIYADDDVSESLQLQALSETPYFLPAN